VWFELNELSAIERGDRWAYTYLIESEPHRAKVRLPEDCRNDTDTDFASSVRRNRTSEEPSRRDTRTLRVAGPPTKRGD
jgi:hypothetical protein